MHHCRVSHLLALERMLARRHIIRHIHSTRACKGTASSLSTSLQQRQTSAGDASDSSPTGAARDDQFTELADTADVLVINLLDYR